MEENQTPKKSKRFLVVYCLCLFLCAAAIILASYISQTRLTREADVIRERLSDTEVAAEGAKSRLDAVMAENSKLNEKIAALEAEKTKLTESTKTLTDEKTVLTRKADASRRLALIADAKRLRQKTVLEKLLAEFESAKCAEVLSPEELSIYNSIK